MAKYVLDADFDYDFSLIALSAHVPDYKMCIELNRLLSLDFTRDTAIDLKEKNTASALLFSCFSFQDEEDLSEYFLLSNTSSNSVGLSNKASEPQSLFSEEKNIKRLLIPELPQTDFLFLLKADNHTQEIHRIARQIKTIPFVLSAQIIEVETLPSKKNLLV